MADNRFKASDIIGADGAESLLEVYGYRSAAAIAGIVGNISRGTAASKTIVSSGDAFRITATGYDGTAQRNLAEISMAAGGTPGSSDMPGSIVFKVTPDGSTTLGTALTIAQDKAITAAGTLAVTGAITGSSTLQTTRVILPFTGADALITGSSSGHIYASTSSGSAPFNEAGHLFIQGRSATVERNVYVVVGTTPTIRGTFSNTGFSVTGTFAVSTDSTLTGDLAVNGGDFTSSATTFNLLNATVTTANVLGAATALTIGATTGTCTIRNSTVTLSGNLAAQGALNVMGDASTDLFTFVGRCILRQVTDAGPMTATGGTQGEVLFNTSDSKFYGCTAGHASAATWAALN